MNVLKALASEGRKEYASLREKQQRLLADLQTVREEMHRLEDHALIEGVDLNAPVEHEPLSIAR